MRGQELVARDGVRRRVGRRSRAAMVADGNGNIFAWVLMSFMGIMGARVELGEGFVTGVEELQGGVSTATATAVELYSAALATPSPGFKFVTKNSKQTCCDSKQCYISPSLLTMLDGRRY